MCRSSYSIIFSSCTAAIAQCKYKKKSIMASQKPLNFDKPAVLIVEPKNQNVANKPRISGLIRKVFDPFTDPVNQIKESRNGKTILVCKD